MEIMNTNYPLKSIDDYFRSARQSESMGNHEKAINLYNSALKIFPNSTNARIGLERVQRKWERKRKLEPKMMPCKSKKIVCLSKSRKTGGFCFGGKEIFPDGNIGGWVRPVSSRETEEISLAECHYENCCEPDLLDVMQLTFLKHKPLFHQCENFLIDEKINWSKEDIWSRKLLGDLCDKPNELWPPYNSSYYGLNDKVSKINIDSLNDSLYFISPDTLSINVQTEGQEFGNLRRKVRAEFRYKNVEYIFSITDMIIERDYYKKDDGEYPILNPKERIFMCVSIGQPYERDDYCYKFVASIIEK